MRTPCRFQKATHFRAQAFTIVEALVAVTVLMIFAVTSTMTLNFFDERAARNRNAEAARVIVEDYVNYLLNDSNDAPDATGDGTDIDGDGTPDGVVCAAIPNANGRTVPASIPLIVKRIATPLTTPDGVVVNGTLYWRVQPVGLAYGCPTNTDLMQVSFLLSYTFRGKNYYYKTVTFKADS